MQILPLKIQKLYQIYEQYLDNHKRGYLATIHSSMRNVEIQTWLSDNNSIGRDLDEKLYMLYHNLDQMELCPFCLKPKKFTLKTGYIIDGNDHRSCKKFPYNQIYLNYFEFYGIDEFKKTDFKTFNKKHEVPDLIQQWKIDHPLFSNYLDSYLLPLFSYVKSENDLDNIPMCKYCGKFKSSINYSKFLEKKIQFNDYCFNCAEIFRGSLISKVAKEKYGVDNFSQLQSVKDKKIKTCQKNYSVDNPMQHEDILDRHMNTCILKYEVENISQIDEIKNKKKETILQHFGSWASFIDMSLGEFCKSIGVDNVSQLDSVKDNKIKTFLEKYGVENIFQSSEFKEKSKQTCLKKYETEYWCQSFEGRKFLREHSLKRIQEQFLNNEPLIPSIGKYERDFLNQLQKLISYNIYRNPRCIGYFVDGYIIEKNLVIEFDEEHHFDSDGVLSERDCIREQDLVEYLNCNIIRIKKTDWEHDKEKVLNQCFDKINNIESEESIQIRFCAGQYSLERVNFES